MLADRARGPTLPSLFLVADTRPSRRHYGVDFIGSFIFIAAAPRPMRLRRGFVVTTTPLSHMVEMVVLISMLRESTCKELSVILTVSLSLKKIIEIKVKV